MCRQGLQRRTSHGDDTVPRDAVGPPTWQPHGGLPISRGHITGPRGAAHRVLDLDLDRRLSVTQGSCGAPGSGMAGAAWTSSSIRSVGCALG